MKDWNTIFDDIRRKDYFKSLISFIKEERKAYTIFPQEGDVFNAFKFTPFKDIKVVIFGQDPYPNKGQAMGLAFSVYPGVTFPPSLRNIFKEIKTEFNINRDPLTGDLTYLAKQGVLLLNPILTVREKEPLSHDNKLYKEFFTDIIGEIEKNDNPIVYLLWGGKSRKYEKLVTNPNHKVICTNHPSPLSANRGGWFNSNCFINANEFLKSKGLLPIDWTAY